MSFSLRGGLARLTNGLSLVLGGIAAGRDEDSVIAARLERLLARRFGVPFSYAGHEELGRNADRGRFYARYAFRPARPTAALPEPVPATFFVKRGPGVLRPALENFLDKQTSALFSTPRFFGHFDLGRSQVGVWEHVSGRQPGFRRGDTDLQRVVEAVAGINALPDADLTAIAGVARETLWVEPGAARLEALIRELTAGDPALADPMLRRVAAFARLEDRLLQRFRSMENRFLTHNDMRPANLIIRPDDARVVVVDWTSARISAPGAGLRFLAWVDEESRTALAAHYVQCMRGLGHGLALDDVLFAIKAIHTFRALSTLAATRDLGKIRMGLPDLQRFAAALSRA